MAKSFNTLRDQVRSDPTRAARVEAHKQPIRDALALAELRDVRELTQRDVAEVLGVSQANISRIERQHDVYLSTLATYVAALGGRLAVTAVFEDDEFEISVGERDAMPAQAR